MEIPQFRLPFDVVKFELQLMQDLGVKIEYNNALGRDFTLQSLKKDGYEAVFLGIGMPQVPLHMDKPSLVTKQLLYCNSPR